MGSSPDLVAKKIEKVLNKKKMKIRYLGGPTVEWMKPAQHILGEDRFEALMLKCKRCVKIPAHFLGIEKQPRNFLRNPGAFPLKHKIFGSENEVLFSRKKFYHFKPFFTIVHVSGT